MRALLQQKSFIKEIWPKIRFYFQWHRRESSKLRQGRTGLPLTQIRDLSQPTGPTSGHPGLQWLTKPGSAKSSRLGWQKPDSQCHLGVEVEAPLRSIPHAFAEVEFGEDLVPVILQGEPRLGSTSRVAPTRGRKIESRFSFWAVKFYVYISSAG